jgi:type III secretion protein J
MWTLTDQAYRRTATLLPSSCVLALGFLAACSPAEPLYSGLSQRDANEMRAILDRASIPATRSVTGDGLYAVDVPDDQTTSAVEVLAARGYPKRQFDTLGTVFGEDGLIRTPLQERARLVHALNEELSGMITAIEGVTDARVMVVVPDTDPLKTDAPLSSASVMVEHLPEMNTALVGPQIRRMVASSVEGLAYDRVTVTMFASGMMAARSPATTNVATTKPETQPAADKSAPRPASTETKSQAK